MDGVQRYIANADDRPADQVERADPALAGVAAQAFAEGRAAHAYIYTTILPPVKELRPSSPVKATVIR